MRIFTTAGCVVTATISLTLLATPGAASALQNPTTGHNGAPTNTCYTAANTADSPGQAINAPGSPFNPAGTSGTRYAGNPSTASLAHSNSTAAVSQYDIACLRVTAANNN